MPFASLLLVPVAPVLSAIQDSSQPLIFLTGGLAIAALSDWLRRATEQLAERIGPALGGLLNVSLGNLAELVLAFFVLTRGDVEVVRAQIVGSIMGTSLLGLGIAAIIAAISRAQEQFKREKAGLLASLLVLVVIALLLPAVFNYTGRTISGSHSLGISDEKLSLSVATILIILYAANLFYTLVTHRDVFGSGEPRDVEAAWPLWVSLAVMLAATCAIAFEAQLVSGALSGTSETLGFSKIFLGAIVLALIGTVSDLFAASWFAAQGKMGLVVSICIGSSIQMAMVVAPILVLGSWIIGHPMTLIFENPLELFAIAGTALIVNAVASDGETTWFEGVLLIGVYLMIGLAFFFAVPTA